MIAAGILRVSHFGFARLVASMRGVGGTPWARAKAVGKFQRLFLGELARVYLPRSVRGADSDFPDAVPGTEGLRGHAEGEWHDLPERPGLRRRILLVPAGDGFVTNLHHIRGRRRAHARAGAADPRGRGAGRHLLRRAAAREPGRRADRGRASTSGSPTGAGRSTSRRTSTTTTRPRCTTIRRR